MSPASNDESNRIKNTHQQPGLKNIFLDKERGLRETCMQKLMARRDNHLLAFILLHFYHAIPLRLNPYTVTVKEYYCAVLFLPCLTDHWNNISVRNNSSKEK